MANLLITGGAGFIGGNSVDYWARRHPDDAIVVLDCLTYAGNRSTIAHVEQAELVVGDIRDTDLVARLLRERAITTVVHFAAQSHVDRSIAEPEIFVETNIVGTHSLLEAACRVWLEEGSGMPHRFHHVSTDEVFGTLGLAGQPFTEESRYQPNSPYAASKAPADHLVRAWHQTYGLETTTSNGSNTYGPYQYPEKLIPRFVLNALTGKPLPIYGDGLHVRDWLYVEDHCHGIEAVLLQGKPGATYGIGGVAELPNMAVIDLVCETVDHAFDTDGNLAKRFPNAPAAKGRKTSELKMFAKDRAGHDRRYAIDATRARTELGYNPRHDFESGLRDTLAWYLANEAWWQPLFCR